MGSVDEESEPGRGEIPDFVVIEPNSDDSEGMGGVSDAGSASYRSHGFPLAAAVGDAS